MRLFEQAAEKWVVGNWTDASPFRASSFRQRHFPGVKATLDVWRATLLAVMVLFFAVALLTAALARAAEYPTTFSKNGQVWIQTAATEPAFQATHDGKQKSAPLVSPNGKVILYDVRESLGDNLLSPLNIVFLDWSGKEIRRFREVPMKELGDSCGYGSVEWIDDNHVGVECEYNPSAKDYLVLSANSGEVEKEYPGLFFSWSPDRRTLAHTGFIIQFATPADQNHCLLFNGKPIYTPACSNEVEPAPKKTPRTSPLRKKGAASGGSRTTVKEEPAHYENIHQINYPLVWSPNGRNLAFVERVYDFYWGMDEKGEETRETGNYRYFLAVVSTDHPAVGYRLLDAIGTPQLEWLDDSRIRLKDKDKPAERIFNLVADPPKVIP